MGTEGEDNEIDDSDEDDYFGKFDSSKSTPASSSSSINKVNEIIINSGVVITNNKEGLMVPKIGGENNKVIAVGDDLDNDMEISEDGFANLTITINKKNRSSSTVSVTAAVRSSGAARYSENDGNKSEPTRYVPASACCGGSAPPDG